MAGRTLRRSAILLVLALVASLLVGTPATLAMSAAGAPLLNEARARAAAVSTGRRVEATALTSETRQVFANPDGSFTLRESVLPVRVRRSSGWVPVDTTLRAGPDGMVAPVASPLDMAFSGGGAAPLVRLRRDGRELALGWPGRLPQPVLSGDTATYRGVLAGVDLTLHASTEGFSQILVVHDATAAANPALGRLRYHLMTKGLTARATRKGLTANDPDGRTVFSAPAPYMWDSSGSAVEQAPSGRVATVAASLGGGDLSLVPDKAMLTGGHTRFPVYIDPSWSGATLAWTQVWSNYPTTSFYNGANLGTSEKVARVGYDGTDQKLTRSFFRFDTSSVKYKHILKATLQLQENWSWSCTAREVQVWATNTISSSTTWKNQPTWAYMMEKKSFAKGFSASSCPAGGVEFNVTAQVTTSAQNGWSNVTQGLRASATAESNHDAYSWKKFNNNPTVTIDYNTVPDDPSNLSTEGSTLCTTGSGRLSLATAKPILRTTVADPDNSVKAHFQWWAIDGSAPLGEYTSAAVAGAKPTVVATTVPAGAFAGGSTGKWRVRAEDGVDVSAWSPWCEFTVDTSKPQMPTVTSSGFPDNAEGNATMGVSLPVTFGANGEPDVARYEYTLNGDATALDRTATPPGSGGDATVSVVPDRYVNWLHVSAVDAAGNRSTVVTVVFYAAPPPAPVADWALDETGDGAAATDASPNGFNAPLAGGASWVDGQYGGALHLDGTTGYAATSGAVLDTTRSFSMSAWVNLTDTTHNTVVASQDGTRSSPFALYYSSAYNRWVFNRTSADVDSPTYVRAISTTVPAANSGWVHLAGVYDAANAQIRLYVNGVLEATTPFTTTPWSATGAFQIGRAKVTGAYTNYWPGDLDQLQVYDRVLLPGEIQQVARLDGNWKLDETAGTTAADSAGSHPATWSATGVSRVAGVTGNAAQLNGTTGALSTSGPVARTDGSFTVAAWAKPTAVGKNEVALSLAGSQVSGVTVGYSWNPDWSAYQWSAGMPVTDSLSAQTREAVDLFDAPTPGTWTHLAAVYDAKDQRLRLYVNGAFVAETFHTSAWNASGPVWIGTGRRTGTTAAEFFTGAIDDVRVYSGVLTDQEIANLYAPSQP
jgi:hypothetical protein